MFTRVSKQRGHDDAVQAVAAMQQGYIDDLKSSLALFAAQPGVELNLTLIDHMILATAGAMMLFCGRKMWTSRGCRMCAMRSWAAEADML